MNLKGFSFTDSWTLFLDRDGVINRRIPGGYVTEWSKFEFLENVPEAFRVLSGVFDKIIVVSNQQGVGKGTMSMDDLSDIDLRMKKAIRQSGGRIDASYYSPHLAGDFHPDRKPGTGLGLKAKADFPGIEFTRSVMVGDTQADMEFGKKLGMVTILITGEEKEQTDPASADLCFKSLFQFAQSLAPKRSISH